MLTWLFGAPRKPRLKRDPGAIIDCVNDRLAHPPGWWVDRYNEQLRKEGMIVDPTSVPRKAQEQEPSFPDTPLLFGDDQPSVFYLDEGGIPYRGQARAKERIDIKIGAMQRGERLKFLFTGPAGTGKTALAWIVAHRIHVRRLMLGYTPEERGRFFEILPSQIETKKQLDEFMRQLRENDIVFIDEVHILKDAVGVEPLYHVLADTGTPRYPLSEGKGWIDLPPGICWLAATTEPGKLDGTTGGALRRRLEPEIRLEPPTQKDLAAIVSDQDVPIHPDAAWHIAERSGGLPWQALLVYSEARAITRFQGGDEVTEPSVLKAFDVMGIDENGLLPEDRKVIEVLLAVRHTLSSGVVVHRMNESALCAAAGVDSNTYKSRVQPKLQRSGYLTTIGGQTLTERAKEEYAYLAA